MPVTTAQRHLMTQFCSITGAAEKTAQRILRANAWKLEASVDSFFASGDAHAHSMPPARDPAKDNLNKLFDRFRSASDDQDTIAIEGTMAYLMELGANLENAEFLVVMEIVQAPGLGEMSRSGFVEGWRATGADTLAKQKAFVTTRSRSIASDLALYKRVYRYSFISQKERAQKGLSLELALLTWQMLFNPPGRYWMTKSTDWLALWLEYLNAKWTKSVNKDMWNQVFEFHLKTLEDETMGFWSEDSAWPGVIDEFVAYAKNKRGDLPDKMETD